MSPLMSLAVFALFALMVPLITIANSNNQARKSQAAAPTPSPKAVDYMMER